MSVLSKIGEYGRMVRFSHSLFAMPFAIGSMWVAANGFRGMDVLQITKPHNRTKLVHLGIGADFRNRLFSSDSEIFEII